MRKSLNHLVILPYAIMFILIAGGLGGSAAWAADGSEVEVSDDIGADGLKHRGDGSIDDHGHSFRRMGHHLSDLARLADRPDPHASAGSDPRTGTLRPRREPSPGG